MMWIYDEEQKCLDEMAQYPEEIKIEAFKKRQIEKFLDNCFTFGDEDK